VLSDLVVTDRQFRSDTKFSLVVVHRLVVEHSVDEPLLVVAPPDAHPHPLPDPGRLVHELDLHVVTALVLAQGINPPMSSPLELSSDPSLNATLLGRFPVIALR
jgi:hypothetical protein